MFGVEKHLKVLIAQLYYKFFFVIITLFIQEILKIRSDIQKRIALKRINHTPSSESFKQFSKNSENGGYVYIFLSDAWEDMIKIGKTDNLDRRLTEANNEQKGTYKPNPPKIRIFHAEFSKSYSELEKLVHTRLSKYRLNNANGTREFFKIHPEKARDLILEISKTL